MRGMWLGYEWDWRSGRHGKPVIYDENRHVTVFGPTRSGKGVSIEIPTLLMHGGGRNWWHRPKRQCDSVLSLDPKLQNCAVTMKCRARLGPVWVLNPMGLLGIPSIGFNPLLRINANSPRLFDQAQGVADILVPNAKASDPFWPDSARGLGTFLTEWEIIRAAKENRVPSLANVRDMATEPVETETDAAGKEYAVKGLPATAGRAVASGDNRVAGLAERFTRTNRTIEGIITTFDTATRWLMSDPIRRDISVKEGADFSQLRYGADPITCFVGLPAHELEAFNAWLRLVVVTALNTIYEQGGTPGRGVQFMLSEYAQIASGGELKAVSAALGQGAGYGVQLAPIVLQDINQLRALHGKDMAETFLGMSGATFSFAANDAQTADYLSRRSGDRRFAGLSASDDPHGVDGARLSWSEKRDRLIPPDAIYALPPFHGLVWFAGQTAPQPVYAPPYWEIPELRGRYSPDPYHQ
jgi:type IV secretion system protein VirD4